MDTANITVDVQDGASLSSDVVNGATITSDVTGSLTVTGEVATGAPGQGVPAGGTANQVLAKIDGTNYNTQWVTPAGVSDGDKGDITVSGSGTVWSIDNNAVTNADLADMATKTYKGRTSALTGDPEDVPVATLKTDLALSKADVGLSNVDNTSDATKNSAVATLTNKSISGATNTLSNIPNSALTTDPLARANHTGTQTASTISDFNSASRAQTEAELIAGTNITITPGSTGATRTLTIAAAGGGGGGITRSIISVTSTVTGAATALTDYVYLLGASAVFTMPTAVSNTNRYTVKNIDTSNKTVSFTSAQTADGSSSLILTPDTSLDLISDGANWRIV